LRKGRVRGRFWRWWWNKPPAVCSLIETGQAKSWLWIRC